MAGFVVPSALKSVCTVAKAILDYGNALEEMTIHEKNLVEVVAIVFKHFGQAIGNVSRNQGDPSVALLLKQCLLDASETLRASHSTWGKAWTLLSPNSYSEKLRSHRNDLINMSILSGVLGVSDTAVKPLDSPSIEPPVAVSLENGTASKTVSPQKSERKHSTTLSHTSDALDMLSNEKDRKFWSENFGKDKLAVSWPEFEKCVRKSFLGVNQAEIQALKFKVDHSKDEMVTMYEFGVFSVSSGGLEHWLTPVTPEKHDMAITMSNIAAEAATVAGAVRQNESSAEKSGGNDKSTPLLLWSDDHRENNEGIIDVASNANANLSVQTVSNTNEAKLWFGQNIHLLRDSCYDQTGSKLRVITDNAQDDIHGLTDMRAGEDLIRYLRGEKWYGPILVYCWNMSRAAFLEQEYDNVLVTRDVTTALKFASFEALEEVKQLSNEAALLEESDVSQPDQPLATQQPALSPVYSINDVVSRHLPSGVDMSKLEEYLSDDDFVTLLGVARVEVQMKKNASIF